MRAYLAILALAIALPVSAQQPDMTRVPGIPVRDVPAPIQGTPVSAPATPGAVSSAEAEEQRKLEALKIRAGVVQATVEMDLKPPPSKLTIKRGVTEVVPMAINQLNRLRTPFPKPVIKTLGDAVDTSVEGNVVYVAASSPEKFALFVWNDGDPDQAIALMLLPRDVVPLDIELALDGYEPKSRALDVSGEPELAEDSYVGHIKSLFRALAQGEVPAGYSLRPVSGGLESMPDCLIPGVQVIPAQLLEGQPYPAIVARAVNRSSEPATIDETACADEQVLAVAAWPRTELAPGEATELYIAVRPQAPRRAGQSRPSVLGTSP